MKDLPQRLCQTALLMLLGMSAAHAEDSLITWPGDWEVQAVPSSDPASTGTGATVRQRGVKNDANGDPLMVMELSRSALQPSHQVNLPGVLLEMRKALQINFVRRGFMSVCTRIHDSQLGNLRAAETTCKITQNGGLVMTQTLVAATSNGMAYALSYAGSVEGYKAVEAEVQGIRAGLRLGQ